MGLLDTVAFTYNVSLNDIRRSVSGKKNDARSTAVYLIRKLNGATQRNIAKWLKVSDAQTIAKMQQRFKERVQKEKRLRNLVSDIEANILSTVKP